MEKSGHGFLIRDISPGTLAVTERDFSCSQQAAIVSAQRGHVKGMNQSRQRRISSFPKSRTCFRNRALPLLSREIVTTRLRPHQYSCPLQQFTSNGIDG